MKEKRKSEQILILCLALSLLFGAVTGLLEVVADILRMLL